MLFLKDNQDQVDRLEDGRLDLKLLARMWRSLDSEGKEVMEIIEYAKFYILFSVLYLAEFLLSL